MFPVVEADRYDFTCKQLRVPVFILPKAPPAGNRLKLLKEITNQLLTPTGQHTHTQTHMQLHVFHALCMLTCSHAHMLTCSHAHMLTWSHAHMLTCSHAHMLTCSHAHMVTYMWNACTIIMILHLHITQSII